MHKKFTKIIRLPTINHEQISNATTNQSGQCPGGFRGWRPSWVKFATVVLHETKRNVWVRHLTIQSTNHMLIFFQENESGVDLVGTMRKDNLV